ncbi:MAG: hypothetical protein ACRCXM_13440 [Beijerinckiaceae bacterium]
MFRVATHTLAAAMIAGAFPAVATESASAPKVAATAPASTAPVPVRVVNANAGGPTSCANAVWPNVPAECLKPSEGVPAPKPVRVVGQQDDLRTNPQAASDLGKAPKKLKRLPKQD